MPRLLPLLAAWLLTACLTDLPADPGDAEQPDPEDAGADLETDWPDLDASVTDLGRPDCDQSTERDLGPPFDACSSSQPGPDCLDPTDGSGDPPDSSSPGDVLAADGAEGDAAGADAVEADAACDASEIELVLVLDYSGSMDVTFVEETTRIQALRAAVEELLDLGLPIQYGLVIFSSGVLATVAVSLDSGEAIREAITRGTDNMTCTACGLDTAGDLLRATSPGGRHVLLVSDGLPNNGGGVVGATAAADRLRVDDGVTIYTVSLLRSRPELDVMRRLAGPAGDPDGDERAYAFSAWTTEELLDIFRQMAALPSCPGANGAR
ncbi:MAG: vWA domain-containing protein [Myxococcota bacterium]|jgi:hypothetical protein|nr:vWA domain-containing protein [Myxococcota bacterium]